MRASTSQGGSATDSTAVSRRAPSVLRSWRSPACARPRRASSSRPERAPGTQPLEEREPLIADLFTSKAASAWPRRRLSADQSRRPRSFRRFAARPLQHGHFRNSPHSRIRSSRRRPEADRRPARSNKSQPVDRDDLFLRCLPYVCGQTRVGLAPHVPLPLDYAARSTSAGIAGIVVVSSLPLQGERDAGRKMVGFGYRRGDRSAWQSRRPVTGGRSVLQHHHPAMKGRSVWERHRPATGAHSV